MKNLFRSIWKGISKGASATWKFLDGNKTTIGLAIVYGSKYLPIEAEYKDIVYTVGELIAGGGGLHKVVKALPKGIRKKND